MATPAPPSTPQGSPSGIHPAVSFVAVSRNDNHGGDMTARMEMFVHSLSQQCDRFGLNAELVLVEWNPPADRPPLAEALRWPDGRGRLAIRIITVPRERHQQYVHGEGLPLYQMIGKNVGIRRARAPWILATNVDVLYSDELIQWLAAGRMEYGTNVHLDRFDVDMPVPDAATLDSSSLLADCRKHLIRKNVRTGTIDISSEEARQAYKPGKFLYRDRLHTNACGDFALTHRDHWFETGAYPELDMYSFHIDTLWSIAAHYAGVREVALEDPYSIYHLEHTGGFVAGAEKSMNDDLAKRKVPRLSSPQLFAMAERMSLSRRMARFTDDQWGLAGEDLPETTVRPTATASSVRAISTSNPQERPRLSLVVMGRNDDHGEHLLERTQSFLDGWRDLAIEEGLRSEIIFVEWNPLDDRPGLKDVLTWTPNDTVDLRIITVDRDLHHALPNADRIPLFQMIAKNVGARRSLGEWVLFTNIDVLFNRPMVRFLARADLDETAFYRTARWDCGEPVVPADLDLDGRIQFLESHLVRVNGNNKTVDVPDDMRIPPSPELDLLEQDPHWMDKLLKAGENRPLFSNACGDFTLLHRDAVARLRGYPEIPVWSIFIDGLLLHAALGAGMRQIELGDPLRMYHIEHSRSWVVDTTYYDRDKRLDHKLHYRPWREALKENRLVHVNPSDWGWAHVDLPEWSANHGSRAAVTSHPHPVLERA